MVTELRIDAKDNAERVHRSYKMTPGKRLTEVVEVKDTGNQFEKNFVLSQPFDPLHYKSDGTLQTSVVESYHENKVATRDRTLNVHVLGEHHRVSDIQVLHQTLNTEEKTPDTHSHTHITETANEGLKQVDDSGGLNSKVFVTGPDNLIHERKPGGGQQPGLHKQYMRAYHNADGSLVAFYERDDKDPDKLLGRFHFSTANVSAKESLASLQPSAFMVLKPDMTLMDVVNDFFSGNLEMVIPLMIANGGISSTEKLPVGMQLQLPSGFFESRFNANVRRELEMSQIVGDINPTIQMPEVETPAFTPKDLLAPVIGAVVTAVAAITLQGHIAAISAEYTVTASMLFFAKAGIGAAALTAGEAARQISGIALNEQHGVKWNQLTRATLIGAVTGGASYLSEAASTTAFGTTLNQATESQQIMAAMQRAAIMNLSQQMVDKSATFSWKQLFGEMILAGIGQKVSNTIPEFNSLLKQMAAEMAAIVPMAFLDAGLQKILQNKEIDANVFALGLATSIAATLAPRAWSGIVGNNAGTVSSGEVSHDVQTPAQKKEAGMERKRQAEEVDRQADAPPSKSIVKRKKVQEEEATNSKSASTKKLALHGYKNKKRTSSINMDWMESDAGIESLSELRQRLVNFHSYREINELSNFGEFRGGVGEAIIERFVTPLQDAGEHPFTYFANYILEDPMLIFPKIQMNRDSRVVEELLESGKASLNTILYGSDKERSRLAGKVAGNVALTVIEARALGGRGKMTPRLVGKTRLGGRVEIISKETPYNTSSHLPAPRSLDNKATRIWYLQQLEQIPSRIDKSLSPQKQALQAFTMRNEIKMQAREFMEDQASAKKLPPAKSLKEFARDAYKRDFVGENFWVQMQNGAQRTDKQVDLLHGLTNNFAKPRGMK